MKDFRQYITFFFKGIGMGAANVIPGVSGGTIALITGIYERLIIALKSFDIKAFKLLISGKFRDLSKHIDLNFILAVFTGIGFSIITLAKLLEYLFEYYPIFLWSFFFGLILASVYYVGVTVKSWGLGQIICIISGTLIAVSISLVNPTTENDGYIYLILCGIVAISSMILPGLSGSFILILMGNYLLVLKAITQFDLNILMPFGIGCIIGLLVFSHFLAWVFKKFRDGTISLLSGFILGSLFILWPWKNEIYLKDSLGIFVLKDDQKVIQGYNWVLPNMEMETFIAIMIMIFGVLSIWAIEFFSKKLTGE